jgi:hypothetical protein
MNSKSIILARAALLLALTLLFQSLRFVIPVPPILSTFLIGSLMNACLLVAAEWVGVGPVLIISFLAPVVAYFQQVLPLPIFIIPVALGNAIYIGLFLMGRQLQFWLNLSVAAVSKTFFMYVAFTWLLTLIAIPSKLAASLLFIMGWPQFVTGIIGGILAGIIKKRLKLL